jgi:bifunctional DNA-binding transcriptional regulator/antitoxin component of YhaV-PrlF toxin-antitoxin module
VSKVTSKLQVTVPKVIAEQYGIRPGDEISWKPAGDAVRVEVARTATRPKLGLEERLALFDASTARQQKRNLRWRGRRPPKDRGWKREDLYTRGLPR